MAQTDRLKFSAMRLLGNGLFEIGAYADALSAERAELSILMRFGGQEVDILAVQSNLACTYEAIGRGDEAMRLRKAIYSGHLKLHGKVHELTLVAANNYAVSLRDLLRFEEAKSLLRKTMPVTRRVLGEGHRLTLKMKKIYADSLYKDPTATLNDLREAVTTLEDMERIARRVLGGAHPMTEETERELQESRAALRARETSSSGTG
ncbi:unnamed protein product [Pelagomonas calceolata]|uniref:MalT-like TPR region domain-containing protein n=1 Tax=Pelagomonas calceolata TaxID=35677 RepID=A0A8J2SHU1_9STRA|nr:unnamed protein product [Pelagomonas calceolata]